MIPDNVKQVLIIYDLGCYYTSEIVNQIKSKTRGRSNRNRYGYQAFH